MSEPNARERAAMRLTEMLTPAAALGIECPLCQAAPERVCLINPMDRPLTMHNARRDHARAELHSLLLVLLGDGTPGTRTVDESGADGLEASGLRWDGLDAAKERGKG